MQRIVLCAERAVLRVQGTVLRVQGADLCLRGAVVRVHGAVLYVQGAFLFVQAAILCFWGAKLCVRAAILYVLGFVLRVQIIVLRVQTAVLRAQTAVLEAARTESRCSQILPVVTRSSQKPLEDRRKNFAGFLMVLEGARGLPCGIELLWPANTRPSRSLQRGRGGFPSPLWSEIRGLEAGSPVYTP